jgi:hypothetical protein
LPSDVASSLSACLNDAIQPTQALRRSCRFRTTAPNGLGSGKAFFGLQIQVRLTPKKIYPKYFIFFWNKIIYLYKITRPANSFICWNKSRLLAPWLRPSATSWHPADPGLWLLALQLNPRAAVRSKLGLRMFAMSMMTMDSRSLSDKIKNTPGLLTMPYRIARRVDKG